MEIEKILSNYSPEPENLLNILHDLQDAHPQRYLPESCLKEVASYLNTTLAQVYGVVNYYTMYSTVPRGRYIIRVCQSPVCHMMGSRTITGILEQVLGTGMNETTADGLFHLEYSECLGICSIAPAMMVGEEIHGPLTEESIEKIITGIRARENKNR